MTYYFVFGLTVNQKSCGLAESGAAKITGGTVALDPIEKCRHVDQLGPHCDKSVVYDCVGSRGRRGH
jgi:hypothetical protein